MNSKAFFSSTILLFSFIASVFSYKVSLYGNSYINLPIQEAKSSTNIRLKFKTSLQNGLILATIGRIDYIQLSLEHARLKLNLKIANYTKEVWSPPNIYFNDRQWHEVTITRYEKNVTFQVNEHFIRELLPDDIGELSIHFGVFLGGLGDFTAPSIESSYVENFRGCISDVYYNNISLLKRAKEANKHVVVERVSWTCSSEFDALDNDEISFLYPDSFASHIVEADEAEQKIISFEFRTINQRAPLFISWNKLSTLKLEIVNGRLLFGVNLNEIHFTGNTSDGKWHLFQLHFDDDRYTVALDQETKTLDASVSLFQFKEFFIGGVPEFTRRKASQKGLKTFDSNFQGCMKNIQVGGSLTGLSSFKITEGLSAGCVWEYPCIEKNPCIPSGICHQEKTDKFWCECDQHFCIRADYRDKYSVFAKKPAGFEILQIAPAIVSEGQWTYISSSNIFLAEEITHAIPDNQIYFFIINQPKYGNIEKVFEVNDSPLVNFTYKDVVENKVRYVHGGDEQHHDFITLNLILPHKVNDKQRKNGQQSHVLSTKFMLHFNVSPINDAPTLNIPRNKIFVLVQGISKRFTTEYVSLYDPDSAPESLIFKVIPSKKATTPTVETEFTVDSKSVDTFSFQDLIDEKVMLKVNEKIREEKRFEIFFEVSDGIETSPIVGLQVNVIPLELRLVNNSGLNMIHYSKSLISHFNLSFAANIDESESTLIILYDIVQQPEYGIIEKMRIADSTWSTPVNSFTSEQIILGQIRYSHLHGKPVKDEFKFTATLGPVTTQTYDFRINLFQFQITPVSQKTLTIHGVREASISMDHLSYQTMFHKSLSEDIHYKILDAPIYGSLFLASNKLEKNETFTQQDINLNHLKYKTNYPTFSKFNDFFNFAVSIENTFLVGNLSIEYSPNITNLGIEEIQSENVQVLEGSRSTISRINFPFLLKKNLPQFLHFNLTEPPIHGFICRYTQNFKTQKLTYFSISQLQAGDIYYCHDDSETESDQFKLLIYSQDKIEFQYIALINVTVALRNDNEPKLVTTGEVLKVVKHEQKIISKETLEYSDDDITTSDKDITYLHVIATNGDLFLSNKPSNTFKQSDINNNLVHFFHRGPDLSGNISFVVSDGLHEARGMLKVKASVPFIKFTGNKVFSLREKDSLKFNVDVVRFEINFDPRPVDIKYEVVSWPNYGNLHFSNSTNKIVSFNHNDIIENQVSYTNLNITSHDKMRLKISCNELSDEAEIIIKIYPSSYWQNLFVVNNETLLVEEEKSAKIRKQNLEIGHQSTIDPREIIFKLKRKPKFGYLHIEGTESDNFTTFDQQTVNAGKIYYVQTVSNATEDYFTVDITNGIVWLKDFYARIRIFPSKITINSGLPLRIKRGSSIVLHGESLQPTSDYYKNKIIDYKIIEKPKYGRIIVHGGINANRFTLNQLLAGHVKYSHSGLNDEHDSIRLIARATNKLSEPFVLNIFPYSEDNEGPKVIENSPTKCTINRKCVIESNHLKISSKYASDSAILYTVISTRGGFVVNELQGKEEIFNFSQDEINNGIITFVLDKSNDPKPEFSFYVTAITLNTSIIEHSFIPFTFISSNVKAIQTKMINVPPGGKTIISEDHLSLSEVLGSQKMDFRITNPSKYGNVQYQSKDGGFSADAGRFSQADVVNQRILYENEKSTIWELQKGQEVDDSFNFKVLSPNYIDHSNEYSFHINVSLYEEILNAIKYEVIRLEEGGRAPLKIDFNAAVNYLKDKTTASNTIMVKCCYAKNGEVVANEKKIFDQNLYIDDFEQYGMVYVHDHSDTIEDEVVMAVYLLQGNIFLGEIHIPVSISPINDQKFYLLTQNPSISMVSGESFIITNKILLTQDVDTPSSKIEYTVVAPPPVGEILKIHPDNSLIDISKFHNTFTQHDINQRKILYVNNQKDSNNASRTIQFRFKVWDSQYEPMHGNFTINIVPVKVSCKNSRPTYILQDNSRTALDLLSLWVDTNVKKTRLHYSIVEQPKFGTIKEVTDSNTREISDFTYNKLESKTLEYIVNGAVTEDSFKSQVTVTNSKASCTIKTDIKLKPIIIINSLILQTNEFIDKIPISFTLDPESPFKLRQLQSVLFTISKPPVQGEFITILRKNDSDLAYEPINSFTVKDIDEGFIYYRPFMENKKISETFNDEFTYKVATNSSTAIATSYVKYQKMSPDELDEPKEPENNAQIVTFTLFGIGFIFATIILFYTLRCCIGLKAFTEQKGINAAGEKPPQLPLPPGFTLNNGRLYSHSNQSLSNTGAGTPTLLSNLPNFKIIAMHETDSTTCRDSELDFVNFDDEEMVDHRDDGAEKELIEESPSQTPQYYGNDLDGYKASHNPLLRRNQYWV